MTDRYETVAAFVDGEAVAASDLSAALAYEDARAYLIDILALRGLVTGARHVASSTPLPASRRRPSPFRLVAAAALVVAGIAGGFLVGFSQGREGNEGREGSEGREAVEATAPAAPAPTHVFRIENGVNWNERAGGN